MSHNIEKKIEKFCLKDREQPTVSVQIKFYVSCFSSGIFWREERFVWILRYICWSGLKNSFSTLLIDTSRDAINFLIRQEISLVSMFDI